MPLSTMHGRIRKWGSRKPMANPEGWRDGLVKIDFPYRWVYGAQVMLFATAFMIDAHHYGFAVYFGGMFLWALLTFQRALWRRERISAHLVT